MGLGHAAVGGDDGAEREAIDVVYLARAERPARIDDLVACGHHGHARPREDLQFRAADGGRRANAARVQQVAPPHHDVARRDVGPAAADVLPRGRRGRDVNQVFAGGRRFLDHDDRVGAFGQRGAGGDFGAGARFDACIGRGARVNAVDDAKPDRSIARRRSDVSRDHGVAVHGRPREGRDGDRGPDVRGCDAAGRCGQLHPLDALDRPDVVREPPARFFERDGRFEGTQGICNLRILSGFRISFRRLLDEVPELRQQEFLHRQPYGGLGAGSETMIRPAAAPPWRGVIIAAAPIC